MSYLNLRVPADWKGRPCIDRPCFPAALHSDVAPVDFGQDYIGAQGAGFLTCILDELKEEYDEFGDPCLWHGRQVLMQAWKENRLYGLKLIETDALYAMSWVDADGSKPKSGLARHFMYNQQTGHSEYILPCFMTSGDRVDEVQMIWVAPRVRRMKLGSLLEQWHPHSLAQQTVPEARDFWTALGFTEVVD